MPQPLDAAAVRRWCALGREALRAHCARMDAINVFPVADGDTGTNLCLTFEAACEALPARDTARGTNGDPGAGAALRAMARAALLAARGNSGAILAEYLRGMARGLDEGAGAPAERRAVPGAPGRRVRRVRSRRAPRGRDDAHGGGGRRRGGRGRERPCGRGAAHAGCHPRPAGGAGPGRCGGRGRTRAHRAADRTVGGTGRAGTRRGTRGGHRSGVPGRCGTGGTGGTGGLSGCSRGSARRRPAAGAPPPRVRGDVPAGGRGPRGRRRAPGPAGPARRLPGRRRWRGAVERPRPRRRRRRRRGGGPGRGASAPHPDHPPADGRGRGGARRNGRSAVCRGRAGPAAGPRGAGRRRRRAGGGAGRALPAGRRRGAVRALRAGRGGPPSTASTASTRERWWRRSGRPEPARSPCCPTTADSTPWPPAPPTLYGRPASGAPSSPPAPPSRGWRRWPCTSRTAASTRTSSP